MYKIISIALLVFSSDALACQCMPMEMEEHYAKADRVVLAVPGKSETFEDGPIKNIRTLVEIKKVYKGEMAETVEIVTGVTSCDLSFTPGKEYVFFITGGSVTMCNGTGIFYFEPGAENFSRLEKISESHKIDYLIAAIEMLEGAEFIRNGKAHAAKDAAEHLRLKLKKAGSRVKTAEDFIKYCASASSVSGKPYQIRFADGHIITAEAYLKQKLAEFEPEGSMDSPDKT
jgi:hypothetical protein